MSDYLDEETQINLTPLIDVVFVILILFMVLAPILDVESVTLAPAPEIEIDSLSQLETQGKLVLHLSAQNEITLNHHSISFEQLKPLLKAAATRFPEEVVQFFPDEKASFGEFQKVKNSLAEAGFHHVDIALKPR